MIPGQKQKQLFHLLDPSYPAFPGPCSLLLLQEGKDLKIRIFFFFQTNAATLNSRSKFNADMSPPLASWVCCSDCCCCPLTSSGAAAPQEVGWRWSWRRWRGGFYAAAAAPIRRWLLRLVSVGGEHICNWCYRISPHLMAAHLHLITGTQIQRHFRLSLENPDWMNVFSGNLIESYSKVCYESMISCSYFKWYQFHLLMSLAEIHTVCY